MNPFIRLLNPPPYVLTSVKSGNSPFKDQGNSPTDDSSTKKPGFNPFMKADIYSTATRGLNPFLQQKNLPKTTSEYPNPFLRLLNSPPYIKTAGNSVISLCIVTDCISTPRNLHLIYSVIYKWEDLESAGPLS